MRNHRLAFLTNLLLLLALILSACTTSAPAPTPTTQPSATMQPAETVMPAEEVLYLNLIWHQHQPLYYKDESGVYTRPWVRVHATKDYYDMAAMVAQYPNIHVTFNLTPVLLRQLDDFVQNGAKDKYWVLAEKPAAELTQEEKEFILRRFFDANWDNMIRRYPGYKALLDKRGGTDDAAIAAALHSFSEQDFRDLQIWFNLVWIDPDELAKEPLRTLVAKDHGFSEKDKTVLFNEIRRIMAQVVPIHKELQEKGQIEVITTPYAHPILPLIYDANLAAVGDPGAELPQRFSYPNDAIAHLKRSVEIYQQHFGLPPKGLWPGEGAVAQEIVPLVARAGHQWMATGEPVLAQSLGIGSFTRDLKETVQEADAIYRPYYVQDKDGNRVAVFFRDWTLSDKVGFTYSGIPGEAAAKDLIQRLENIRTRLKEEGAKGPHIVSIILDGENAWEYYKNDGKEFLNTFYRLLSESKTIQTITPSEYLRRFPDQRSLEHLFPGAWFSPNYDTWIGEPEENQAWEYLRQTRELLAKYDMTRARKASPEAIAQAQDYMYLAEGSDWFWWYGADQDSGQDEYFDTGFRALLRQVYLSLGEPVPPFIEVPIIQARPVAATRPLQGIASPQIDGTVEVDEWTPAAYYANEGGRTLSGFEAVLDAKNLYLKVDAAGALPARLGVYVVVPRVANPYPFTLTEGDEQPALLGVAATHAFIWSGGTALQGYLASPQGWQATDVTGQAAAKNGILEIAIPLSAFGQLETGDELRLVIAAQPDGGMLPAGGPAQVVLPDLGLSTVVLDVEDPEGDDHGPGTYTYPTDAVFQAKAFDLKAFRVSFDENNVIFRFTFYGPVPNPWGSPNNLAIQTLDVYVDKDPGAGTGARLLLPGRNAALKPGDGWDIAVWAEGWTPQILVPDPTTLKPKQVTGVDFKILVDPAAHMVTLRVPRQVFGEGDPSAWGYVAVVLGQEGFPSTGVWRVRDIEPQAAQWRFGGGPADNNHTRIIDMIWPADAKPTQEEMLGTYSSSTQPLEQLTPDDFPQLELLRVR